jgi:hypothetical protein
MYLREEKKDEIIYLKESLQENDLIEKKEILKKTIEAIKLKRKSLENGLLINKTVSFVEEDSEKLGHLIVNHKFDQIEITEESGKLIEKFERELHQTSRRFQ